jgi:CelD/BcsL family acetyltransferase involved in cellulose biosynthesis
MLAGAFALEPELSKPTAGLHVEEVSGVETLLGLREEWDRLLESCPWATPFQSPEWVLAWCHWFQPQHIWVLSLWNTAGLVGLAPFSVRQGRGGRMLTLLGTGLSDHGEILFRPELRDVGMQTILQHLVLQRSCWDFCELHGLRRESPLLTARLPAGWRERVIAQEAHPVLQLPARVEMLEETLPAGLWRRLAYVRRMAARTGVLRTHLARPRTLAPLLETLMRLQRDRWQQRGVAAMLAGEAVREFHREAARGALLRGRLRLHALSLDGRPIAALYGYRLHRREYYYLSGFDTRLARLSPGDLLLGEALRLAVADGITAVDFLRGDASYRHQWGARSEDSFQRLLLHAPSRREKLRRASGRAPPAASSS